MRAENFELHLQDDELVAAASSIASALMDNRWSEWTDPVQPRFFNALFSGLYGYDGDFWNPSSITPDAARRSLVRREARETVVSFLVSGELLCRPIPVEVHQSVERWAAALGVDSKALSLARDTAAGAYFKAQADLYRHGYWGALAALQGEAVTALVEQEGAAALAMTMRPDPELAQRWRSLGDCQPGTLGRAVYDFYTLHGFEWPGESRGANPITAHHDWIHVLADYSATGLGEIETAAFRMTSTRLGGTLLTFLGELGFWHSGMVGSAFSGWHEAYSLDAKDAPESVAEAFRRGAACTEDLYLRTDFFDFKDEDLIQLRQRWCIPPKTYAGSPGWQTRVVLTRADGEADGPPDFTV